MKMMLYGAERYFLEIHAKKLMSNQTPLPKGIEPMVYDCEQFSFSWDQLFEELMTVSLFDPIKVIYCYNPQGVLSQLSDAQYTMLLDLLENLPEEVVFFMMIESPSFDQRLKLFKHFKKANTLQKVPALNQASFNKLVAQTLSEHNLTLSRPLFDALIKRLPMEVLSVKQEIKKLASYPHTIDETVIANLISRPMADSVFELSQAIMNKDHLNAWQVYEDLLIQKHDPVALIPAIAWQYRVMFHILHYRSLNLTQPMIKERLNEHDYTFSKAWQYANQTNKRSVMRLLDQLAVLDQSIKTGRTDKKMGFERFLLEAMR